MRAVTFFNLKGGVGKTVMAVGLAIAAHKQSGKPVLLIDADTQGGMTRWTTGGEPKRFVRNLGSAVAGHNTLRESILDLADPRLDEQNPERRQVWKGVYLIPCSRGRISVDRTFGIGQDFTVLRKMLVESGLLDEYIVLIDSGHGDTDSTLLAVVAGDTCIIIVNAGMVHSLSQVSAATELIQQAQSVNGHEHVSVSGAAVTNYDSRYGTQKTIVKSLTTAYGDKLFAVVERRGEVERAIAQGKPLQNMPADAIGRIPSQFDAFAETMLKRVFGV